MEKKSSNGSGKMGVGLGLGVIVAGVAGAYYLYGTKDGAKNRVKIKGWALKAKAEVVEKLEKLKEVNEENYNEVLESVMKKYQAIKNIDKTEVEVLISDMRKHWKNIKRHIGEAKATKTSVKRVAKKVVKDVKGE